MHKIAINPLQLMAKTDGWIDPALAPPRGRDPWAADIAATPEDTVRLCGEWAQQL
jgi:hypothetical protein